MKDAPTIALDFDGVLHQHSKYTGPVPEEPPVSGAQDFVRDLMGDGYEVVIFSHRAHTKAGKRGIVEWLIEYGFPELEVMDVKPAADLYIDDRGYRFDGDFGKAYEFAVSAKKRTPWNRKHGQSA